MIIGQNNVATDQPIDTPTTPNFLSGCCNEIIGDYVQK